MMYEEDLLHEGELRSLIDLCEVARGQNLKESIEKLETSEIWKVIYTDLYLCHIVWAEAIVTVLPFYGPFCVSATLVHCWGECVDR